jgi:hypothetical protein
LKEELTYEKTEWWNNDKKTNKKCTDSQKDKKTDR